MVERLQAIDVDEIACLIDFGVDVGRRAGQSEYLNEVRRRSVDASSSKKPITRTAS